MSTTMGEKVKRSSHPIFCWPGSVVWVFPLLAALLLFWFIGGWGSVWWYIAIPALVALVFIDLFSSVWFGILILSLLFIYSSIGSAGVPISLAIWEPTTWMNLREIRSLEMTEFEWFHWWMFKWLVALLCLTLATVTIRKIPRNILTVGVWSIHTGVIVMVLGCTVYFSQKIEGDVLVSRRQVVIQTQGEESKSMVVTPRNTITIGDTSYTITDINPNWTLMSGEDAGKESYSVSVSVQSPEKSFIRQLIAGYPEYTEDIVQSGDPNQPMARAKNVTGSALVDKELDMKLAYDVKEDFFVTQSGALYLRELSSAGTPLTPWIERPIENLPRYNDYIAGYDDVWTVGATTPELHPLSIFVKPRADDDPVQQDIVINSYLRYAHMNPRVSGGGNDLFPVVWVTLSKGEDISQSVELYAFEPSSSTTDTSLMTFRWLGSESELAGLEKSLLPMVHATIAGNTYDVLLSNSEEFQQIGDTGYACKIKSVQNNLNIGGRAVSLAIVELQHGAKTWERWVFDNPTLNRDVVEGTQHDIDAKLIDDNITMTYSAGAAPITIVGGLNDNSYHMLTSIGGGDPVSKPLTIGQPVVLTDDITITLDRAEPYTYSQTRPMVVPPLSRDPSAGNMYSMVQVVVPTPDGSVTSWLPYHHYPFESTLEVVRRFQYKPNMLQLPNGTLIEIMFSRRSMPLIAPIALESFEVESHLGGFTGRTPSILNWRSIVLFFDDLDTKLEVSVNEPKPYGDLWFFQSQWDPPDSTSSGMNYTVLGVGNRRGVLTMLLGCCITVSGMIWAFYVKPTIKRRRQQAVYKGTAA